MSSIPFVSVAVVNLAFDKSVQLPVQGFGYLVPQSEPSVLLGVIFDSDIAPEQDRDACTKVTCMLGGYLFEDVLGDPDTVSKESILALARQALKDQLKLDAEPIDYKVSIHKNCIPQYVVGHDEKIDSITELIENHAQLKDKLSLVGASYNGVGINDCILSAYATTQCLGAGMPIVAGTNFKF